MFEKQPETGKELKSLVLMGICPCCGSVRIKYSEYITNRTFGFKCFNCGWTSQYNLSELKEAANGWFPIQKK
ncbi:hypothetical protein NIES267_04120 [Calothrix parasitica NIES-267]|uniref:Uncharacterized protein n=1 Tax=Calothrix parasitica NIES-267 TaxID=1973488 RepID=A0A1Z4LI94_9CYAN|nr:hypothetical protein NIES267_04120 [Calothrix parasitica NIES-267]